ncbi:amidase signature enzyme [Lactarius hengduanensis]|nr:amidase signature enzyme [Lactarius hengduanensis]
MQRDISRRRVSVLWAVVVFLTLQFLTFQLLLCGGPSINPDTPYHVQLPDLYEASIAELQDGLENGHFTSVDLVKDPRLRAVIELNPSALQQAAELDLERRTLGPRGPLHGIPILLKDNIATRASDGMNTTAGSFALLGSLPPRDATVAAKLRAAGAILLGQANLSEWAHFRGALPPGFSGRGGQATSPYFPLADPSGSSSGSGIAIAIGLAAAALGTETDGSIILPSSRQNLVGIKPTVGLTSRAGVIPVSENQDSVGPMARSVADAAVILTAIAGRDPLDNFTLAAPALRSRFLQGSEEGRSPWCAFNASLLTLAKLGATIVGPAEFPDANELLASMNQSMSTVLSADFMVNLEEYISGLIEVPTGVKTMADLIAFNIAHAVSRAGSTFLDRPVSLTTDLGRTRGIDATLAKFKLDAIIIPTDGFASGPAAVAGYPVVTVPLGFQPDTVVATPALPTIDRAPGVAFELVGYAFAYEQATHTRLKRLAFPEAIPKTQLADVMEK